METERDGDGETGYKYIRNLYDPEQKIGLLSPDDLIISEDCEKILVRHGGQCEIFTQKYDDHGKLKQAYRT